MRRLFCSLTFNRSLLKQRNLYRQFYSFLSRYQSQSLKADKGEANSSNQGKDTAKLLLESKVDKKTEYNSRLSKYSSDEDDISDNKWKPDVAWLTKALEPVLQFYRWATPTGDGSENRATTTRSFADILASIQRNKVGIQDWSLSDLTLGLFLLYLRQTSANSLDDVKGVQISSESVVLDLIYHLELAKGCYKDGAAGLARCSMLRESNVLKFVKNSSVMRPGYYIGVDGRKKLVILGIRGTHTVYDLITDIISSGDEEVTFEGYSTHFGTAEAARWFLHHEMGTIKNYLNEHKGFRLRLVGHSLGGAIASLLAIMLRQKSHKELGFNPDIVHAVGYATAPCVSKELAESCSHYVSTVVMQDDIVPRLSVASLARLRNEIAKTDWMGVLEKEDWKSFVELVTNAKQVMSTVQDAARRVAYYANMRSTAVSSDLPLEKKSHGSSVAALNSKSSAVKKEETTSTHDRELFIPGTVYYLKRNQETDNRSGSSGNKSSVYFSLWKRQAGDHFKRIPLSSNLISVHKCNSHLYALRDVIKGLPGASGNEGIFS